MMKDKLTFKFLIIQNEESHTTGRLREISTRFFLLECTIWRIFYTNFLVFQNKLREQRQQIARAKKYHNDYHVQHRARLMRARTKEERVGSKANYYGLLCVYLCMQMFRQLFEEGLGLQKLRLREQRAYAKEQQLEHQRRHQDQIESLENYYKDQGNSNTFQTLMITSIFVQALLKMKRELRSRMEREIRDLQRIIIQNDEDDHFQDLEVQRLRNRVHMASFQYNTSYLH
ncbi:hypothetical protein XENOCAPTIV_011347 [Xenoophorus captivus]|uniref:Uncharacterized protein n=1 Tax=Xenoophorus captivus TaxID=1517983 RepID=A0ABV0RGU9_9TELE